MKKIKIIGITGQSGAGKSSVSEFFKSKGFYVINADLLVSELYGGDSPCLKLISELFGKDIINSDQALNRRLLAQRAFSSKEAAAALNRAVHPFVTALFLDKAKQLSKSGKEYILYDAPQLFESNADILCDFIIGVIADRPLCIKRICKRDNITESEAEQRLGVQLDEEYYRLNSDYIIENNGDSDFLEICSERVYNLICAQR